jgi:hypothetical protein
VTETEAVALCNARGVVSAKLCCDIRTRCCGEHYCLFFVAIGLWLWWAWCADSAIDVNSMDC